MRLLVILFVLSTALFSTAQNCMVPQDLQKSMVNSHTIIEGKVISQTATWNGAQNMIYTLSKVEVYRFFKGGSQSQIIDVVTQGGTIGLNKIEVEPELELEIGDFGIFTLEWSPADLTTRGEYYRAYGGPQGFFAYDDSHKSAQSVFFHFPNVQRDLINPILYQTKQRPRILKKWKPQPRGGNGGSRAVSASGSITSFSPTSITSGTKSVLTITGSGFGATQGTSVVQFKNANDGGSSYISPAASEYISWSNTQIQVEVPTKAGTGNIRVTDGSNTLTSSSNLTVTYAILNITNSGNTYQANHTNQNASGGVTFTRFNDFANQANAAADFSWALTEWKCNTGINWGISGTNTTTDASVSDGINIVRFDNGNELNASTLGVCASYYSGCNVSGTLKWIVTELDVTFNDDFTAVWHYGGGSIPSNNYDFRSVALHEMGHGHQLGHVINSSSVMHYALSNGAQNAVLSANEIAGGNYQMNLSTNESRCGQPVMVATNCNTAPVANFTASPNVTCTGSGNTIQFNNTSTFNPTSYAWDVNGDNVTDYTTASPSHTYPAAGLYTVTLTVTNSVGSDSKTINIYAGGGYTAIGCSPTTVNNGNYGTGINTFAFNTIQYTNTSNNNDGLLDLICSENTIVSGGQVVPFTVTLDGGNPEYCKIWIDYNNDGTFNNSNELVYNGTSATSHTGNITIPASATQGVILRMRVISDFNVITGACANVSYGEINDFGVYLTCTAGPIPTVTSLPTVSGECSVSNVAAPTATDACTGGTVTGTTSDPTSYANQGTYTITWTYAGSNGSTTSQTQSVVVDDVTAPVPSQTNLSDITAPCQVTSLTAPTANDNCSGSVTGTNNASLPITAQGTTVVTWTYTDGEGNSSTQTQNVIISDNVAPQVQNCPSNQVVSASSSGCTAVVNWAAPTATDNCGSVNTSSTHNSGDAFGIGTTTVTYTFTDNAGNQSTCSFVVTVESDLGMSAVVTPENGSSNGAIDLTVIGGSPVYSFDWDTDGTGDFDDPEDLAGLVSGNYTVVIKDGNDCTSDSTFVLNSQAGLGKAELDYLEVFPNPASETIYLQRNEAKEELIIQMTNSLGQQLGVFSMTGSTKAISIGHLAQGVYFFEINQNGETLLVRFVKN